MGQLGVLRSGDLLLLRSALIMTVGLLWARFGELRRIAHLCRARQRRDFPRLVYFVCVLREHGLARLADVQFLSFLCDFSLLARGDAVFK